MLRPAQSRRFKEEMNIYSRQSGFTLLEVMVASTIGAFISLVAVGTLQTVIYSSEMADKNITAASEIRFALNIIERDLTNLYRDENIENTRLIGSVEDLAEYTTSYLVFYTLSRSKARILEPEGEIYEVEYYLEPDPDGDTLSLMRRMWPNPNELVDPGGILTVLAENIEIFDVRFYDGEEWYVEWLEEMESLPQLIEVTISTQPITRGDRIIETFLVNLEKSVTSSTETLTSG